MTIVLQVQQNFAMEDHIAGKKKRRYQQGTIVSELLDALILLVIIHALDQRRQTGSTRVVGEVGPCFQPTLSRAASSAVSYAPSHALLSLYPKQ